MQKKKLNRIWLYLSVSCVFSACQLNQKTEETNEQSTLADTLTYDYQHYTLYSEQIVKTNETTDTAFYTVSYPSFNDSTVNHFVLATLLGDDTATVTGTAQTFIGEFDEFFRSESYPRVWTSESHVNVK